MGHLKKLSKKNILYPIDLVYFRSQNWQNVSPLHDLNGRVFCNYSCMSIGLSIVILMPSGKKRTAECG